MTLPEHIILDDPQAVAAAAARHVLEIAGQAIETRDHFRIVLAGGSTPQACYQLLAGSDADWSRWSVAYGDERCLPADHPERNSRMASQAWLERVAIPPQQHYPIPAELGAADGAEVYTKTIVELLPFDLVLLGMGEDGHTASLFPGQQLDPDRLVQPVWDAPKPPAQRISLDYRTLAESHRTLILVTGAGKAEAIRQWRQGEPLPIARLSTLSPQPLLIMDRAAAGE